MDPLEQEIAELIIECTGLEDMRPEDIDPAAPLFVEGLGLDSIDALEIGVALAKRYSRSLCFDRAQSPQMFFHDHGRLLDLLDQLNGRKRLPKIPDQSVPQDRERQGCVIARLPGSPLRRECLRA